MIFVITEIVCIPTGTSSARKKKEKVIVQSLAPLGVTMLASVASQEWQMLEIMG